MNGGSSTKQNTSGQRLAHLRERLPAILPTYLPAQRWFAGKAARIDSVKILDVVPLDVIAADAAVFLVRVQYASGLQETYALPLIALSEGCPPEMRAAPLTAGKLECGDVELIDALQSDTFLNALLKGFVQPQSFDGAFGRAEMKSSVNLAQALAGPGETLQGQLLKSEQSNSSIHYGERLILKLFRRLSEGVNPELEMGEFLSSRAGFSNTPHVLGSMTYTRHPTGQFSLAVLQEFVPNDGDAWHYTLVQFAHFLAAAQQAEGSAPALEDRWFGAYLADAEELGRTTAGMHLALASDAQHSDFAPEPWSESLKREVVQNWCDFAGRVFELLRHNIPRLPEQLQDVAKAMSAREDEVIRIFQSLSGQDFGGMLMRVHGDYHLGQVLHSSSKFVIIDFEGEPARPIAERRAKQSALKDVAGMLRSFDYAAHSADLDPLGDAIHPTSGAGRRAPLVDSWRSRVQERFLSGYLATAGRAQFLPETSDQFSKLLKVYLLEKAIYELQYELNSRPEWVGIPLGGIKRLLDS